MQKAFKVGISRAFPFFYLSTFLSIYQSWQHYALPLCPAFQIPFQIQRTGGRRRITIDDNTQLVVSIESMYVNSLRKVRYPITLNCRK